MVNVELVIKVPEELYEAYKGRPPMLGDAGMDMIAQAISKGVPLPKGHGRLIECERLQEVFRRNVVGYAGFKQLFDIAPIIVEADRSDEV